MDMYFSCIALTDTYLMQAIILYFRRQPRVTKNTLELMQGNPIIRADDANVVKVINSENESVLDIIDLADKVEILFRP